MDGWLGLFFASVADPRAGTARHDLSEVLFIAFAAVLCGAETCVDLAEFGGDKADLPGTMLALEHGVPSLVPAGPPCLAARNNMHVKPLLLTSIPT